MVVVGIFNVTSQKTRWRVVPVLFAAIVFASILLPVLHPNSAAAATAAECAKLNGLALNDNNSPIFRDDAMGNLWIDCYRASLCDQDINQIVHCSEVPVSSPEEYARTTYAGGIKITATAICTDAKAANMTTCVNNYVSKFTTCFNSNTKAGEYDYDLGKLSECTDKTNASRFLQALDVMKSKVDAYTGGTSTTTAAASGGTTSNSCGISWAISWLACPVTQTMAKFAEFLGNRVADILYISPDDIFTKEFQSAWSNFRNIGIALILIAGLFMVISQSMGLEILDAYTIRKLLPRLGIALMGMALSWSLLKLAVDITNSLGLMAHDLILSPFKEVGFPKGFNFENFIKEFTLAVVGGAAATATVVVQIALLGPAGVLALLGTALLALFIGLLVLFVREIIIVACILFAPLAIASYVLPGTQKLWKFWKDTFVTSLIMFPLIMGFLAIGEVLARIQAQMNGGKLTFTGIIVYFAPYFMLPFAFKLAGGLMTTIFSIANDKSRGLFDRGRKFRQETKAYRKGEFASGSKTAGRLVAGYSRRSTLARQGGFSISKEGRAEYAYAKQKLVQDTAEERFKKDNGYSSGDTDATWHAIEATSQKDFVNRMTDDLMKTKGLSKEDAERQARISMARLEAGSQAKMGSTAMQAFAFRGTLNDNAGWEKGGETDWKGLARATHHLVASGIMDASDVGALLAANPNRGDISSQSFGDRIEFVKMAYAAGQSGRELNVDEVETLNARSYASARNSGALLGNQRTATALSKQTGLRTTAAMTGGVIHGSNGAIDTGDRLDIAVQEMATMANMQDMMSSAPPKAREAFSAVLQQPIKYDDLSDDFKRQFEGAFVKVEKDKDGVVQKDNDGNPIITRRAEITKQEVMEYMRSGANEDLTNMFTARRREYSARGQQYASEAAARDAASQAVRSQLPIGGPGTGTVVPGPSGAQSR